MKILGSQLRVINAWPVREFHERETKRPYITYCFIVNGFMAFISIGLYIFNNVRNLTFFEMGHSYITLSLSCVHTTRIIMPLFKKFEDICTEFVMKIHLFNYRHRSEFAMKTHLKIQKISSSLTLYVVSAMISGSVLFNVLPIYNNYKAGMYSKDRSQNSTQTYNHALFFALPFDVNRSLKGYILFSIYTWCMTYFVSIGICAFDLLLYLMVIHLWGHFHILINSLQTILQPKDESWHRSTNFNAEESSLVHEKLKECIVYHQMLLKFVDKMSTVFGPILCAYTLFHLFGGCMLLLESSQMSPEAFVQYVPVTILVFQLLIQMSSIFELLGTVSEKLYKTVYEVPWECMDRRNRSTVLIILMQVRKPVRVKALGIIDIGVTTMTAIIKTSFSYYTFLRSMAE